MRRAWLEALRSLGTALLELLQAEATALTADLKASGRRLAGAVVLLLVALFAAFWALAALGYALVETLDLWLPRWGAAFTVFGALVVVAAGLAGWARLRLRRLETPAVTVRRRLDESVGWWNERIASGEEREELPPGEES